MSYSFVKIRNPQNTIKLGSENSSDFQSLQNKTEELEFDNQVIRGNVVLIVAIVLVLLLVFYVIYKRQVKKLMK